MAFISGVDVAWVDVLVWLSFFLCSSLTGTLSGRARNAEKANSFPLNPSAFETSTCGFTKDI